MGQALIKAAQWTTQDGKREKLEFSALNDDLLSAVLTFIETTHDKTSDERKLVFKKPLTWTTQIKASAFNINGYIVKEKLNTVVSEATTVKGDVPLLELKDNKLSIMTLEQAEIVLKVAGAKKKMELRACLEENADVVANMLGDRFAIVERDDNSLIRFSQEIMNEIENLSQQKDKDKDQMKAIHEKKITLILRLKLLQLDEKMLNACVLKFTKDLHLNPRIVDSEIAILQVLAGQDETNAFEYIQYFGHDYVFENGCRSILSRQAHGDICHLAIKCHDVNEIIYVTANTSGYYLFKGPQGESLTDIDYSQVNNITFNNLISLIKDKSEHFAEIIARQDLGTKSHKDKEVAVVSTKNKKNEDEEDVNNRTSRQGKADHSTKQQNGHHQEKERKQTAPKQRLEPSLRWKAIAVEDKQKKVYGQCYCLPLLAL